jgi:diaminopimelate epimerase
MRFSKLQGTGNDFILVDARAGLGTTNLEKLARAICNRHFGVGADGLMLAQNSAVADLKMRLFNSDGSEAEVSGNGLRCFAKFTIENGLIGKAPSPGGQGNRSLTVETLAGIREVRAYLLGNSVDRAEVNMGVPRFRPEEIPVRVNVDVPIAPAPILDCPLPLAGKELTVSIVSVGNPHAVSFLSNAVADFPLCDIGPKVESHPLFPRKTNFEVARVLSREKIEARVWERGVGETLACGSGASAIAVVAQLLGYIGDKVDIILDGGPLTVSWDGAGDVLVSGPVEEVFTGEWLEEGK